MKLSHSKQLEYTYETASKTDFKINILQIIGYTLLKSII
jgi:hypothetical protein